MSDIYVSLMAVSARPDMTAFAPVPLAKLISTNQKITGSTTAAKSTVTTAQATIVAALGANWHTKYRIVWSVTIVGSDWCHLIFGKSLTAGSYNTGNAAASSFVRNSGVWEFEADGDDQELVVLHTV